MLNDTWTSIELNQTNSATQLLTTNDAIASATKNYQNNEKTVNELFLNDLIQDYTIFTANEILQLKAIAQQCPLDGGKAVFRARALLNPLNNLIFNDEVSCSNIEPRNALNTMASDRVKSIIAIYPNPANNFINISVAIEKTSDLFTLSVYDLLGRQVLQDKLTEGLNMVNVDQLEAGVYLFKISGGAFDHHFEKVMIHK